MTTKFQWQQKLKWQQNLQWQQKFLWQLSSNGKVYVFYVVSVKSTVNIVSIFVAFLENTNFNNLFLKKSSLIGKLSLQPANKDYQKIYLAF